MTKRPPIVVSVGNVRVKIYRVRSNATGYEFFQVADFTGGRRKLISLADEAKARERAQEIARKVAGGEIEALHLTGRDRNAYLRALELLESANVPIELAADEYAEARQKLGGVSLATAVDFYVKRHLIGVEGRAVADVIAEFMRSKVSDKLSKCYLDSLRHYLGKFAASFSGDIGAISGASIASWLRATGLSPRSRNNLRNAVQSLFRFAKAQKYLPRDHDEIDSVALVKADQGEIGVFTPSEMAEIMCSAGGRLIPFCALGGFAGIRNAEILRLDWKDIRFEDGLIEVHAAKAKTASRRIVPMLDNLRLWLLPYRSQRGPVCTNRSVGNEIEQLVNRINRSRSVAGNRTAFAWRHNGLRHSFVSYRVAVTQNVNQVALEAGNSPQVIFRNYRELVRPAEALAWFSIVPQSPRDSSPAAELGGSQVFCDRLCANG